MIFKIYCFILLVTLVNSNVSMHRPTWCRNESPELARVSQHPESTAVICLVRSARFIIFSVFLKFSDLLFHMSIKLGFFEHFTNFRFYRGPTPLYYETLYAINSYLKICVVEIINPLFRFCCALETDITSLTIPTG